MTAEVTQTNEPTPHNSAVAATDRFAGQLLRAALDAIQNQKTLWSSTKELDQQVVIDRLRNAFEDVIRRQMYQIAAAGLPNAEVVLHTITAKGDAMKAVVTISDHKTAHAIVDAIGRKVVLVLVDVEQYTAGMKGFKADKDQPDLPLEQPAGDAASEAPQEQTWTQEVATEVRNETEDDLQRFAAGAAAEAERFKSLAERGVIDGRSERVKHQDAQQGWPEAPKFPQTDGEAA